MTKTIDRRTTVIIFSSTIHIDKAWGHIVHSLKRRGINIGTFQSVFENGVNMLEAFLQTIEQPIESEEEVGRRDKGTPVSYALQFMRFGDEVSKDERNLQNVNVTIKLGFLSM